MTRSTNMLLHSICLYPKKMTKVGGPQKAWCFQCFQKSVSDGQNIFLSCFSLRNILNLHFAAPCEGIFEAQPYILLQLAKGLISKIYTNWTQFENHVHCTCMYMLPFYFIDTLSDTNSTGWVDDTNQIIVVLLVCWDFIPCAKEPRCLTHIVLRGVMAQFLPT